MLQTQEKHGVVLQRFLPVAGRIKSIFQHPLWPPLVVNMEGRPHLEGLFMRIPTKAELQTYPALDMKFKSFWVFSELLFLSSELPKY